MGEIGSPHRIIPGYPYRPPGQLGSSSSTWRNQDREECIPGTFYENGNLTWESVRGNIPPPPLSPPLLPSIYEKQSTKKEGLSPPKIYRILFF